MNRLLILLLLAGCNGDDLFSNDPPMTTEEIIAARAECEAAGLRTVFFSQPFSSDGAKIKSYQCQP